MDEAAAAVAAHLGIANEEEINSMPYIWFSEVLTAIGKKISYESVSNLYGNSFAKDADKEIRKRYPLMKFEGGGVSALATMIGNVKRIDNKNVSKEAVKSGLKQQLGGGLDWADGLFE